MGRLPTCYSPVRRFTHHRSDFLARLACVKPPANVRSEPGSNSPLKWIVCSALLSPAEASSSSSKLVAEATNDDRSHRMLAVYLNGGPGPCELPIRLKTHHFRCSLSLFSFQRPRCFAGWPKAFPTREELTTATTRGSQFPFFQFFESGPPMQQTQGFRTISCCKQTMLRGEAQSRFDPDFRRIYGVWVVPSGRKCLAQGSDRGSGAVFDSSESSSELLQSMLECAPCPAL